MNIQLKGNEFQETVDKNKSVILDFYADWCGPCQALSPTVEKLAAEFDGDVAIKKVNVDENRDLASEFGVRSIPTLVYFSNGKEVNRSNGLLSETQLRDQIDQLKSA